ncbi:LuxR C-terminal-related transcriptional regulator [Herbiconiux sp. CPCC 205716]|uniref:LuxR C-terminal-related transcriptional regulator n=1 Tax=Herbiconiux gentiana TaxID=2970912 RepID=A0ABT2GLE7_9MICO|nr:LuxR C-terminal-related transcriptional regulator [Herbiconiux gentiana]MCS5715759.1 LuxR C-terminal-related transcriptional regulator [Herbiconiux gentiana]
MDELATLDTGPAPRVWSERSVTILTGVLLALARAGRLDEAQRLIRTHLNGTTLRRPSRASEQAGVALLSAAAEVFAAAGWPRQATLFARRALSYAERAALRPAEFRARALLALARALNGEYSAAEESVAACGSLRQAGGWAPSTAWYPLLLAEILIASARFDVPRLDGIAAELRTIATDDPTWAVTATATEGMSLLLQRDLNRGLPLILAVINGSDSGSTFSMVQGFALGIYADLLLSRGDARRTLTVLQGHPSPAGHALCFDMQRAAAHLLLGQNREALTASDECLALGVEHCLRTIPPLLFRRAIAHLRLGHDLEADDHFEEAFHLVGASGSGTPLLTLPAGELRMLLGRLVERRPELGAEAASFDRLIDRVPVVDQTRFHLPDLTRQEERLAKHLRSGDGYAVLAEKFFVSPNTVKTQARSLYAKLNVSSRGDAVTVLERAGFYK